MLIFLFFTKSKDGNGFNKISTMIGKLLFLHYDINSNCGDGNISIGIEDSCTKSEIQIDGFIDLSLIHISEPTRH